MATFHVLGVFGLKSRKQFVIVGDVADGVVEAGMGAEIRLPNGTVQVAAVLSVEFADWRQPRETHVGLICHENCPVGVTAVSVRNLIGSTITVI